MSLSLPELKKRCSQLRLTRATDKLSKCKLRELYEDAVQAKWNIFPDEYADNFPDQIRCLCKYLNIPCKGKSTVELWRCLKERGLITFANWPQMPECELAQLADRIKSKTTKEYIPIPVRLMAEDAGIDWNKHNYTKLIELLNLDLKTTPCYKTVRPKQVVAYRTASDALNHIQTLIKDMPFSSRCIGMQDDVGVLQRMMAHEKLPRLTIASVITVQVAEDNKCRFLKRCKSHAGNIQFIYWKNTSESDTHVSVAIVRPTRHIIEYFDPYGYSNEYLFACFKFLQTELPTVLSKPDFPVINCFSSQQAGPQTIADAKWFAEDGGYCVVYCHILLHLCLLAPTLSAVTILSEIMKLKPTELLNLARKYLSWQEQFVSSDDGDAV